MPANSIGKDFEREVVRDIREAFHFLGITYKDCFRTPMSGGHHALPGVDIQMSPIIFELFPFAIECKSTKKFHCGAMMKPRADEQAWAQQALKSAKDIPGSVPLLVMKDKRIGVFAALPLRFHQGHAGMNPSAFMQFTLCGQEWIMFHWKEWLTYKADMAELNWKKAKKPTKKGRKA
jgi:hypothetical protein